MPERTNQEWLAQLRSPSSESALEELRSIIINGLRASLAGRVDRDLEAITEDFTQEALIKIVKSLDTFRGESKFVTWAQKIAIHVAFTELRRRRWKDVSLQSLIESPDGNTYTPSFLKDPDAAPETDVTRQQLLRTVIDLIDSELTARQRTALLAVVQSGMPIDELAAKMGTNRNALYKLIHDARQRLQKRLTDIAGLTPGEILAAFDRQQ